MREGPRTHDFDWILLAIVSAICLMGMLEIYSATHDSPMAGMHWRQAIWIGVGFVAMFIVSRLDYHTLLDQAPLLYLIGIIALLFVLVIGHSRFGATPLGQPRGRREFTSVGNNEAGYNHSAGTILQRSPHRSINSADLVKIAGITGLPVLLVLVQPDLGTAMVLVPAAIVGAFLAGIQWKHLAVLLAFIVLMIPVGWKMRTHLKPYQQQRIATFIHPEDNPRGAGYQILQSEIAVGSGGFWGKGFGKGSQNQLGFVPVRYSDFILAAMAEELGFVGVLLALLLYLGLLLRLIDNAQKAKDRAGMFVVMGVAAILGFHVLVNSAMVIGYVPVTGIPLPFMSYGGSSTVFLFLALGLVMNVRMRRFVN